MENGKGFLIDTDIIIDYLKGKFSLNEKIKEVGLPNCYVSEITIAELQYGAVKSNNYTKQIENIEKIKTRFGVVPITDVLEMYGAERLRLEKIGKRIEDFDLLIAVTSVSENMVLVTGNVKHHSRVENVVIQNWRLEEWNKFI